MDPTAPNDRHAPLPARQVVVVVVLVLAALLSATVFAPARRGDLAFFLDAYRAMVGASGLEVYADIPNIQSGPIALLGVGLLDGIGPAAFPLAVGLMYVVALLAITRLDGVADHHPLTLATGGLVLLFWWRTFAFQGHLDDATVVALALVALAAVHRDRRIAAALVLGACLAIKPWAVFLVPLTIGTDGPWRRRLAAPAVSLTVGALAWVPFLAASTGTLDGIRPTVWSAPDSVLRLVSGSAAPMPTVARIGQLTLCLLAVAWVTARGHASLALFLGVALRLLLDGGTWPYYTAGLVAGALVVDLRHHTRRLPWLVLVTSLLLPKPTWIEVAEVRALLRAVACVAAVTAVWWIARPRAVDPMSRTVSPAAPAATDDRSADSEFV